MDGKYRPLRSGELAELAGVSPDTIRHYERLGILAEVPRSSSGYRLYAPDALDRIRLIRHALRIGFTLDELSKVLCERDQGGAPCRKVLHMTEKKLAALRLQIQELKKTERYMQNLVDQWRDRLSKTAPGSKALLLHSLSDPPAPSAKSGNTFRRRKQP